MNGIYKEVNNIILIHHNEYKIETPALPYGICVLKIIIHEIHLDTNVTTIMF